MAALAAGPGRALPCTAVHAPRLAAFRIPEVNEMTSTGEHRQHQQQAGTAAVTDGREPPLTVSHKEMDAAFDRGRAIPVAESVGWLMRYRAAWWVLYEEGWLRVTDAGVAGSIDRIYPRIAEADTAAARDRSRHGQEEGR
jgi:hypothetical protein